MPVIYELANNWVDNVTNENINFIAHLIVDTNIQKLLQNTLSDFVGHFYHTFQTNNSWYLNIIFNALYNCTN